MKCLVVFGWTINLTAVAAYENDLPAFEVILQTRQLEDHLYSPSLFSRGSLDSTLKPYSLQRRADPPTRRRSHSPNRAQRLQRSSSISDENAVSSSAKAQGPAIINTFGVHGPQDDVVPEGQTGHLRNSDRRYTMASARANIGKSTEAQAQGQTVFAQVVPPVRKQGRVKYESETKVTEVPIYSQYGQFSTFTSPSGGPAKVTATSPDGGLVQAFATKNEPSGAKP